MGKYNPQQLRIPEERGGEREEDGADDFRRSLEQNIIDFQNNSTEQTVDRIYEAIIRLRVHGAVSYVLRDVSAEEVINSLRETVTHKNSEIERLNSENIRLVIELQKLEPTRKPVSKDFSALS